MEDNPNIRSDASEDKAPNEEVLASAPEKKDEPVSAPSISSNSSKKADKKGVSPVIVALASVACCALVIVGLAAAGLVSFGPQKKNNNKAQSDSSTSVQKEPEASEITPEEGAEPSENAIFIKNPNLNSDTKYKINDDKSPKIEDYLLSADKSFMREHYQANVDYKDPSKIKLSYYTAPYTGKENSGTKELTLTAPGKVKAISYDQGPAIEAFTLIALLEDGRIAYIKDSDFHHKGKTTLDVVEGPKDVQYLKIATYINKSIEDGAEVYPEGLFTLGYNKDGNYYLLDDYIYAQERK